MFFFYNIALWSNFKLGTIIKLAYCLFVSMGTLPEIKIDDDDD